jgi:polysaccharide pyruvyl transferase CsaB
MKIVLSGYYGFDNAGDEALLVAITTSIKRLAPDAEFVVFSGSPARTVYLHGIPAVHYMNPWQVLRELSTADLLISGGGSIFQDVTSARSLAYYISVVALARMLGKPVIFYAQGVGPINRRFSRCLMRLVANRVNIISLRDEDSRQYLLDMGVNRVPMEVTADPVFCLEPGINEEKSVHGLLTGLGAAGQPRIGVAVRQWQVLDQYRTHLANLLDELTLQGYRVIFIPMAYPEDIAASRRVMDIMSQPALLVDRHLSSSEHLALIAGLDLLIGMRLHALIFAASRGVPFAGISYDPKIDAFLNLFGLQPLPASLSAMQLQVQALLGDDQLQSRLRKRSADMRSKAEQNAQMALSLIKTRTCKRN